MKDQIIELNDKHHTRYYIEYRTNMIGKFVWLDIHKKTNEHHEYSHVYGEFFGDNKPTQRQIEKDGKEFYNV